MLFANRELLIATMHQKQDVIAPVLERELGVRCVVPTPFDTDRFGTFSGEKKRIETAIATARQKCIAALHAFGGDLVVSSEGSFGNHPYIPFAMANEEILMLIDQKHGYEIIARTLTLDTNFSSAALSNVSELEAFLENVAYASHGIIFKPTDDYNSWIKCIGCVDTAKKHFLTISSAGTPVRVETDMRAMYNPTRMKIIAQTTEELVRKVLSLCPQCNTPGFGVVEAREGLPCKYCQLPTRSTLTHVYGCQKCAHTSIAMHPHGKTWEDPMYCDFCNP